jgi:hypothetical protein
LFAPASALVPGGRSLVRAAFTPLSLADIQLWLRPDLDLFTDGAVDLDGSSQYLSIADGAPGLTLAGTSFTLAAWINIDAATGDDTILGKYRYSTNERSYALVYRQATSRVEFWISSDGINVAELASGTTLTAGGGWYFVVARYNFAAGSNQMRLSINNGASAQATHAGGAFATTTADFTLGADSQVTTHFDGQLDSVGVWNRELDDAEVVRLHNGGAGRSYANLDDPLKVGLVSWWNLDEASGDRADAHGPNTLTATGGPSRLAGLASGPCGDEDTIIGWFDQAARNHDAVLTTLAKRPTLERAGLMRPRVVLDGIDDALPLDSSIALAGGCCLAWVSEPASFPGSVFGSSAAAGVFARQVSATQTAVSDGTNTRTFTHASQSGTAVHVVNGGAGGLEHYLGGAASSASGTSFGDLTLDQIGVRGAATEFYNGGLGDIVVVARALSKAELNRLGRYLADLHRLSWTTVP